MYTNSLKNLKYDIPSSIAVFLVAVPLCLGIAHASGAPLLSGLISGVIGGVLVGMISQSQFSVSGPAAGLTAIVLSGISDIGSFEGFLVAVFIAGIIQLLFGILRVGKVSGFLPVSLINGMLSAIGVILLIKQLPYMLGYNSGNTIKDLSLNLFGIVSTTDIVSEEQSSFYSLKQALSKFNQVILLIGVSSFFIILLWDKYIQPKIKLMPAALIVVVFGIVSAYFSRIYFPDFMTDNHFVNVPSISTFPEFLFATKLPQWDYLSNVNVYTVGITIAVVASIETLLSIEAMDKIDTEKRVTPPNRELIAQGIGNTLCGLIGGIPITAVVVRGSVNIAAGAKSQYSAILHGILILISVAFLSEILNIIPLSSLAAILVYTGYKLINLNLIIDLYKESKHQFLIMMTTLISVVLTDLLVGIIIGLFASYIILAVFKFKSKSL
jgi:MFS superfamily sulfate permease-like transporter